ncbi:MAG: rhomboid family intramembrane serine protease [Bacteroidia bacterium]|nr:rhomboid family intramembrane serine protease [Bacteroidia bacterium]
MVQISPVVKNLIIVNVIVFLLLFIPFTSWLQFFFILGKSNALGFREAGAFFPFQPYQIVTSFFAHTAIFHLLFNMLALYSIGVPVEMALGSKRFLKFYLFCGVVAALVLAFLDPQDNPVIGASTAISGILAAYGIMFPTSRISFFFLPPIEAKTLFIGAAVISAILALLQIAGEGMVEMSNVSHFGHLAGMLAGVLFFYLEKYIPFLRN